MQRTKPPLPRRPRRLDPALGGDPAARASVRRARSTPRSSRRSRTARSKRSCASRRRSGSSSRPTASIAAPGGTSISSGASTASRRSRCRTASFHGVETRPEGTRSPARSISPTIRCSTISTILKSVARVTPKMCIPAPPVMHFRLPKDGIPKNIYADIDEFFADLGKAYAKAVKAFYDAGCRYLQFDDTVWAYLCSPAEMLAARERMPMADNLPADLPGRHQYRAGGEARRHDDYHACVPRQLQVHLGRVGRLRAGRRAAARRREL